MSLDLSWDGSADWIGVAGRLLPAHPALRGEDPDGARWWAAAIPFENQAALLVIVDEDESGMASGAVVQLLLPAPGSAWTERFEALPCVVDHGRIRPVLSNPHVPEPFDFLLTDGWWAELDDARELHRYVALFGALPVAAVPVAA